MALDSCLSISQVAKLLSELRKLPDERPLQTLFPLQDHRGHRDEINPGFFEDTGGDLVLGADAYAYVPGAFEIDLPPGEVGVEVVAGFDRTPVATRLDITADGRPVELPGPGDGLRSTVVERGGQPVKTWAHISLADLMLLDGDSALQQEWTEQVRARGLGRRRAGGDRQGRRPAIRPRRAG